MELHLNVAQRAARQAGQRLLALSGTAKISRKQSSQNLVTQADIESEDIITRLIHSEFPQHRFLREEGESTGTASDDHLWIIDPLDATNNYAHGIPHFSLSIAYAQKGVVQVGVVYDPLRQELFSAVRGQGATLQDQPLQVTAQPHLTECILATGFYYDRGQIMQNTLNAISRLFSRNIRGIRRMGSAAIDLCWVACGRFDGFFEYKLAPWDYAAGSLIVEEAGGRCADRLGATLTLDSWNIVASNPLVFNDLMDTVRWSE